MNPYLPAVTSADDTDSNLRMFIRGSDIMRPSFARRDPFAALNVISRAAAMASRDPMGALQRARAEHPDDYELHETLETRAAVVPTSAASVGQFSQTSVADVGAVIGPMSAFTLITARALAIDLGGPSATVSVPSVASASGTVTFIAPGEVIPVKQFSLVAASLTPRKCAAIVTLTREASEHTSAEKIIRALMIENVSLSIDKLFLDATDTDSVRPAGLRYGTAALTSAGSTSRDADLTTLVAAVAPKAGTMDNVVLVASPDLAAKIMIALPNLKIPVYATAGLAAGTIAALACNALAVAATPRIDWSISSETVLHMEDASPLAISTVGTPNTVAASARSLWQTDAKALRLIFEIDWKWRTTGAIAWMTSIAW